MTGQLEIAREGHLGIIALNRPEAINALNLEMIEGIVQALEQWRDDDEVRLVLFEGRGPRGFCSGGDVRAARAAVIGGRAEDADRFFAAEYAMNGMIASYPKPLAALAHGIVMGGGIGIAGHCQFRFTTADSRYAMPEAAIGFVSDVGVNYILGKAPKHRALAFLLSGVTVGAADAINLGLADCAFDPARRDAVRAGIVTAAGAANIDHALVQLMQAEVVPHGEPVLCFAADQLAELDWDRLSDIQLAVTDDPVLAPLLTRSPTSLTAIAHEPCAGRGPRRASRTCWRSTCRSPACSAASPISPRACAPSSSTGTSARLGSRPVWTRFGAVRSRRPSRRRRCRSCGSFSTS